jgi:hypothetical protein
MTAALCTQQPGVGLKVGCAQHGAQSSAAQKQQ